MSEMGKAMMGTGEGSGENRALDAAESAISNPLLDDVSMKGAKGVLINITGGNDMTLYEVDEAANRIRDEVDPNANIIFGSTFDDTLEGLMRVSVVATGIDAAERKKLEQQEEQKKKSMFGMASKPTYTKVEEEKVLEPAYGEAASANGSYRPSSGNSNYNSNYSREREYAGVEERSYERPVAKPKPAGKKSFFGRMADAFSGSGDTYGSSSSIKISSERDFDDDDNDDDMDIPTFLRKR
jgi:cell division protein FtsZ